MLAIGRGLRVRRRAAGVVFLVLGLVGSVVAVGVVTRQSRASGRGRLAHLPRAVVHRGDLLVTLTAPGRIETTSKTSIQCALENLSVAAGRGGVSSGGSATILFLVPEGTLVKKDDVLCQLDSAGYVEVVRQQEIQVQEARTALMKAELDLQAAEIAYNEYSKGTSLNTTQDFNGRLALAESDLRRQTDRLVWAERMLAQKLYTDFQIASERQSLMQTRLSLAQTRRNFENFKTYSDPISLRVMQGRVQGAKAMVEYNQLRLQKTEERLVKFQQQVEYCTIRAPHDGFLIYANEPDGDPLVEVGSNVRQKQTLFYLPDMTTLEVQALLHESILDRVRVGMPAGIRVEAEPESPTGGEVLSISALPMVAPKDRGADLKNFLAKISIRSVPEGTRPGMSAEVEIATFQKDDVLIVPVEALSYENGQQVCYVATDGGLERREVRTGQKNREMMEITDGLVEGEEVVLGTPDDEDTHLIVESATSTAAPADDEESD